MTPSDPSAHPDVADDPVARLNAAVSDSAPDAIAWARSALALHGLGEHPAIPTVASPVQIRCVEIHGTLLPDLAELDTTSRLGIPVASLPITVASMAGTLSFSDFDRLVGKALRSQMMTWARLEQAFAQLNRAGKAGWMLRNSVISDRTKHRAVQELKPGRNVVRRLVAQDPSTSRRPLDQAS